MKFARTARMAALATALALTATGAFAMPPQGGPPPQGMPDFGEMFLRHFDADEDGKVTKDEFLKPSEAQFDHMDSNHDGAVDAEEVAAMKAEMMQRMQERHGGMMRQP